MKQAESLPFLKLLEIALIIYLLLFGPFLFWAYAKISLAEKKILRIHNTNQQTQNEKK